MIVLFTEVVLLLNNSSLKGKLFFKKFMIIADFVKKWQPILTHWNGAAEDHQFAEDCWACGFEMDRGE